MGAASPPPGSPPEGVPLTDEDLAGLRRLAAGVAPPAGRGRVPTVIHVGRLGGVSSDFLDLARTPLDGGLRVDVVAALLGRARAAGLRRPTAWLTRPGPPTTEDVDLQWYAAVLAAYAEAGVPPLMLVVTATGWYDPGSDRRRTWKRLRVDR